MSGLTDERMKEIADILGETYIKEKNAIGDSDSPGTMSFEIQKLIDYSNGITPKMGLLLDCTPSIESPTEIKIANGTVVYDYNEYEFEENIISINKTFKYSFDANCHYGFIIVFSIEDLATSALSYRTKLSANLTANTSIEVEIDDTDLLSSYTPPFCLTIDGEEILIWSISENKALISPNYNNGTVVNNHILGAIVFVNKPLKPQAFIGLPVGPVYQSGGNPETFEYYPPVPETDYILLCRGIAEIPNTIETARTPNILDIEDIREFIEIPVDDLFTSTEKNNIEISASTALSNANVMANGQSSLDILLSLKDFTITDVGENFEDYWNDRPFVSRSNYIRGQSFNSITRFEFSNSFKEMFYDFYNEDLLNTFAIFRGDIYGGDRVFGSAPANFIGTYVPVTSSIDGNLTYGTWIYRVTAVTISGETSPTVALPIIIPASAGALNKIQLSWDAVSGALYYNIYRMGMSGINYFEYRLTTPGEVVVTSYEDMGAITGLSVNRGILFTGKQVNNLCNLKLYVPPTEGNFNIFIDGVGINDSYLDDDTIQNELIFNIYGIKEDLTIGGPHNVTVPQGTERGTKFDIGTENDLYIGVYDVVFSPGTSLNIQNGKIMWSPYDLVVIQNI